MAETGASLSGWGRVYGPGREVAGEDFEALSASVSLSRGLGRSYGDSSLPAPADGVVASSRLADRILGFNAESGVLRAEAGFSLYDLNRTFWPRRFAAPVAPGTQFVTLGGMISADVHGKDHHVAGCVGSHVISMRIRLASGDIVRASREDNQDLLDAAVGGMGLLGHILEAELRLARIPSPWVMVETERIPDIDGFLIKLREAARAFPFTMGWIDTLGAGGGLGRGILMRGRWANPEEEGVRIPKNFPRPPWRPGVPFVMPEALVSRPTVATFNALYFAQHLPTVRRGVRNPEKFFYPLDAVQNWNRLYGRRGFTQYQCVIPEAAGAAGVRDFLRLLRDLGGSSMLSVIKDCGAEGAGILSFPMKGVSIALDLPVREGVQSIVQALNNQLIELGGRIYLAKDRFTRAEDFARMERRLDRWRAVKRRFDPQNRLRSAQSERLGLAG